MERNIDFVERCEMKKLICLMSVLASCVLLSSCSVLCQAGTGTCGMTKEEAQRLLNPKSYGQYWTKPAMSIDNWRQDWVACGGMQNGNYSSNAPSGSTTAALLADDKVKKMKLDTCMQSKGYQFSYTGSALPK